MALLGTLFKRTLQAGKALQFNILSPRLQQKLVLARLLRKARNTDIGRYYGFSSILDSGQMLDEFSRRIPIHDYNTLNERWWKRYHEGKSNITWPGKIKYFALSSGTSEAASKYIPVSGDMIKSMRRTSLKQMLVLSRFDFPSELFEKGIMMLGGSASLKHSGHYFYGDLSGINTSKIPLWFTPFFKPGDRIAKIKDWEQKIQEIALQAKDWDIWVVTGIPSWMQLLFERIIQHYQVQTIHDIWPNLQVFAYGGVAIDPYLPAFSRLCSRPLSFIETYLASEGFLAYDTRIAPERKGMRLSLNNGIYYEFIPFDEEHFNEEGQVRPEAKAIPLDQVQAHQDYALLITTCSGAWRYLIGDTVRFEDLAHLEIRITGRIKHFLSLCGEHLSMENINESLLKLAQDEDLTMGECAVMGLSGEAGYGHRWYLSVAADQVDSVRLRQEALLTKLDNILCMLNDDYEVERRHALARMEIVVLSEDIPLQWMSTLNKLGGQHKFPRVLKGKYAESWLDFVRETTPVSLPLRSNR
jgi:hypothetical protein